MKLRESIVGLSCLLIHCGGSSAPPVSPNAPTDPVASAAPAAVQATVPAVSPSAAPASPAVASAATTNTNSTAAQPTSSAGSGTPAAATKGNLTVTITSTPATAAKHAVVYLKDGPTDREVTGKMDNRQMAFVPYVAVVTAGAKVTFTNSDPFPHNVFSPDNEKWDMGMIPAHGSRVRKFEKPSTYTVLCNVHPNMKAYIVVVPSSYFAKADKGGEFMIHDVPAGKYKLVAWAPGVKTEEQDVAVDGDKTVSFDLHR